MSVRAAPLLNITSLAVRSVSVRAVQAVKFAVWWLVAPEVLFSRVRTPVRAAGSLFGVSSGRGPVVTR